MMESLVIEVIREKLMPHQFAHEDCATAPTADSEKVDVVLDLSDEQLRQVAGGPFVYNQ